MVYTPLARKWRPKSFADLVGQDHIVLPLQNALLQNKLHHAYLFTGTRGIGKTTVARIFAKALNCQLGVVAEPCLTCENCLGIDNGQFFDLIEVDGASRTRVEDTRELIENIQYAPASGRFKIFLIDEVHMLSTHSFNALLKTLEEPPSHIKFLLATTDPQKLPATILSRCLQFNLNPMSTKVISAQLERVLSAESFQYSNDSLKLIAELASGSMRDALTATEQLMAVFPSGFEETSLREHLGYSLNDWAIQVLTTLLSHPPKSLIQLSQTIAQQNISYQRLLHHCMQILHECAIYKILPEQTLSNQNQLCVKECAKKWSAKEIHQLYLMIEKSNQELDWAPNHAIGFQMLCLRMFHYLQLQGHVNVESPTISAPKPLALPEIQKPSKIEPTNDQISIEQWCHIVDTLPIEGLGKSALSNSIVISKTESLLHLEINPNYKTLFTANIQERIENALSQYFKHPIKIKLTTSTVISTSTPAVIQAQQRITAHSDLKQTIQDDPFVQKLLIDCQAEIIENSMTKIIDNL